MSLELVKSIADAVLYEGYILYPYRASAVKNQQRFNFGVLAPRDFCQKQGGSEASSMRTECLIEGDKPALNVRVRFLHVSSREVYQLVEPSADEAAADDAYRRVAALEVGGDVYHTWQEAVEREVVAESLSVHDLSAEPRVIAFGFPHSQTTELLIDTAGNAAGRLVRRQQAVGGAVAIGAEACRPGLFRVSVAIENTVPPPTENAGRDEALLCSLASTHTILSARDGQFVSLIDPPEALVELAAGCTNVGTWPVLAGDEQARDTMLSSPIILYDYPQIAPESGGDFFDGTEIDEMLALRVMTLTDEEKREMGQLDERARAILRRTESLPPEQWQKLHGAIRGLKTVQRS